MRIVRLANFMMPTSGGLRTAFYPRLAAVANSWNERMGLAQRYPAAHAEFLKACHRAGAWSGSVPDRSS